VTKEKQPAAATLIVSIALIVFTLMTTGPAFAAEPGHGGSGEALFLIQLMLLLVSGRLLGEAMQRLGQPAVTGQLISGTPKMQTRSLPAGH